MLLILIHRYPISTARAKYASCFEYWYCYWLRLLSIHIQYSKQCEWLQLRAPWLMLFVFCAAFSLRGESVTWKEGKGGDGFKPLILIEFLIEAHCRLNIITGPSAGEYFFFKFGFIHVCISQCGHSCKYEVRSHYQGFPSRNFII